MEGQVATMLELHTRQVYTVDATAIKSPWQVYPDFDQSFARLFEHVKTPINRSQGLGISRLQSVLRFIIPKTWAYQLRQDQTFATLGLINQDSDQSFTRLWHIKTPINCSQDLGISKLWSIICMTWAYPDICPLWVGYASLANDWSESCEWLIEIWLCKSLANDWSESGYAQIL